MYRLCCLLLLLFTAQASAHPISISDAYVEVQQEHLDVRIEVFVEDLYLFHDLKLNEESALPPDEVQRGAKLHQDFVQKNFKILLGDGTPLKLESVKANFDDLPTEPIPFGQLMFFQITYEFRCELEAAPQFLTFLHQFIREKDEALPAEVQVKVKPLTGRRYQNVIRPNQPWTVRLSSDDKESSPENMSAQQQWEQQREQVLGITSYGQTYAFLYLEEKLVRLEFLVPLATLARSLEQPLEPDGMLSVEDQQALDEPIRKLLEEQISMQTGEKPLAGEITRLEFFGVSFRDFSQRVEPQPVSIANARIGVIIEYPLPDDVQSGKLIWNLFNQYLYDVNLAVIEGEETTSEILRQVEDQKFYIWKITQPEKVEQTLDLETLHFSRPEPDRNFAAEGWFLFFTFMGSLLTLALGVKILTASTGFRISRVLAYGVVLLAASFATVVIMAIYAAQLRDKIEYEMAQQVKQETEFCNLLPITLNGIYQAFNQRNEVEILRQLNNTVDDSLRRELYLEIARTMQIESQGGAKARAGAVTVEECDKLETDYNHVEPYAQKVRCRWKVPGSVEHWGHIHQRTTSYQAVITLAPRPKQETQKYWKMIELELENLDQSVIETSIRQF